MRPKKEFSDRFIQFEKIQNDNNLIDLQIDGIYLWRLIRSHIFVHLLEDNKTIIKPEAKNTSFSRRLKMGALNLLNFIIKPQKWSQLLVKIAKSKPLAIDIINSIPSLFFITKLFLAGSRKPVFVSAFIRNIGHNHKLTNPAETKYKGEHILLDKPSSGLFATHRLDTRAFNMIAKRFFKANINEDIGPAVTKISNAYGVESVIVNRLAKKHLKAFKSHEAAFLYFFQKSKFEKLYLCWNRYYFPLLSAAKKAGINTFEFQHGTITPYHSMYAWEGFDIVPYSPDNLLCFGPSWPEESNLAKSISPIIIGAPHIEDCKEKYKTRTADKTRVVIFSQNVIGLKLLNFSVEVARLRPDLKFTFKPHPTEHYINLSQYIDGKIPDNLKLASPSEDSYELMASATYQIGVSSTTLNEGMAFGNRVIIVPFASWEYLENAIKRGHASLADTPQKAADLLVPETSICIKPSDYYATVDLSQI